MLNKYKEKMIAIVFLVFFTAVGGKAIYNEYQYIKYNVNTFHYIDLIEDDSGIQSQFFQNFPKRKQLVDLNAKIRCVLGQREMRGMLKLKNGHLIAPQEKLSDTYIHQQAKRVIRYSNYCKSQGKKFVFVQPILKIDEYNKQLPAGTYDYSNENIDRFLTYLKQNGVEVMDIRSCMRSDGLDMYDYTYKTDHHWTIGAALYTSIQIEQWVGEATGVTAEPEVSSMASYQPITYPNWHLGLYGQQTGQYFAGTDDFTYYEPTFYVSFMNINGTASSFYEGAVNRTQYSAADYSSRSTYDNALYLPSGTATTSKPMSIYVLSDSYAFPLPAYLKLAYSECNYGFCPEGFRESDITKWNPDVVVLMPFYTSTFSDKIEYYPEGEENK